VPARPCSLRSPSRCRLSSAGLGAASGRVDDSCTLASGSGVHPTTGSTAAQSRAGPTLTVRGSEPGAYPAGATFAFMRNRFVGSWTALS
jgi:hypothetical protein